MVQLQLGSSSFYVNLGAVYSSILTLKFVQRYSRQGNTIFATPVESTLRASKFTVDVPSSMEEGQYLLTILDGATELREVTAYVKGDILTPDTPYYQEFTSSEGTTYFGQ